MTTLENQSIINTFVPTKYINQIKQLSILIVNSNDLVTKINAKYLNENGFTS